MNPVKNKAVCVFLFVSLCQIFAETVISLSNVTNGQIVKNCNDVLQFYSSYLKNPLLVTDCYQEYVHNFLLYRIDEKMDYKSAQAICRLVTNSDVAPSYAFFIQRLLNALYMGKYKMDTWMWIGATRQRGTLQWNSGGPIYPLKWYGYPDPTSQNNGDCAVMLVLTDSSGDTPGTAGTYYYTENCNSTYIAPCMVTLF